MFICHSFSVFYIHGMLPSVTKCSNPHLKKSWSALEQSHMNLKYSPTEEMYFCFKEKVTLYVNERLNSNSSSSEEEVKYSAVCFLTGGSSHPK